MSVNMPSADSPGIGSAAGPVAYPGADKHDGKAAFRPDGPKAGHALTIEPDQRGESILAVRCAA